MSSKYLEAKELEAISDLELDQYSYIMLAEQTRILTDIDVWTQYYELYTKEYSRRKGNKVIAIDNQSETRH